MKLQVKRALKLRIRNNPYSNILKVIPKNAIIERFKTFNNVNKYKYDGTTGYIPDVDKIDLVPFEILPPPPPPPPPSPPPPPPPPPSPIVQADNKKKIVLIGLSIGAAFFLLK